MPTRLPSGILIFNVTPHPLNFWCGSEEGVVVAPSDGVINASPVIRTLIDCGKYTLTSVSYAPIVTGEAFIKVIRKQHPDAVIVGSFLSAQAYPDDVVAPVPLKQERSREFKSTRLLRSDRFAIYPQEKKQNA